MLKKIILFTAISVVAGLGATPTAALSLLNGQQHHYTVQFRSDNKATVYAKLVFQNGKSDKDRDTYTFSLPTGVSIDAVSVQQILAKSTSSTDCFAEPTTGTSTRRICPTTTTYNEDFDFLSNAGGYSYHYNYYYPEYRYGNNYEYTDIAPTVSGETYTVKLPQAIKPHKQGAVLVTFLSTSYVKSAFGGQFNYDFRTLKTDEVIDDASVAINFDEELYSRDVTQQRTAEVTSSGEANIAAGADASYKSRSTDSLLPTIGNGGKYTRSQTKMLPGDVMSVTGTYATKPVLLYLKEIAIGIVVVAALSAGLWFAIRHYRKTHPRKPHTDAHATATDAREFDAGEPASIKQLLAVSGVSIVATVISLLILTGLVAVANSSYSGLIPYILSLFTIVVVGTTAVFAPIAYVLRFGVRSLLRWLLINAAIIAVLCFAAIGVASIDSSSPEPYYGTDGCINC